MKHVVSFSTGLSSALTAERVIKRYGVDDVIVAFMDTTIEHPDNYRFQKEMYARWKAAGLTQFVTLIEGRSPYQVSEDENMIFNQRRHPCTRILKIKMFMDWLETIKDPIVYIGFDFAEVDRCEATTRNYREAGYEVDYPLLWKPIEFRKYAQVAREDWGIEPPIMYTQGYSHANCGGTDDEGRGGCVAMGLGDWVRRLINEPVSYAANEAWEATMRKRPGLENYAICRDQSSGKVTPLTLKELREQYENKKVTIKGGNAIRSFDNRSSCVRCGVGDLVQTSFI